MRNGLDDKYIDYEGCILEHFKMKQAFFILQPFAPYVTQVVIVYKLNLCTINTTSSSNRRLHSFIDLLTQYST